MRPESLKYLYDVLQAAKAIDEMCNGKTFEEYLSSLMLRSAVERQFEIAGEALSQLGKVDPETFGQIPDARQIVSFRNFLIHNYATINSRLVWGVIQNDLSNLCTIVQDLLAEGGA